MEHINTSTTEFENGMETNAAGAETPRPHSRLVRRRIAIFATVITTILLTANTFVCATWIHFSGATTLPAWPLVSFLLVLAFVATTILGHRYSNIGLRFAYRLSILWLGILNFSFFAACATWIIFGVTTLFHLHLAPELIARSCFGLALLASLFGFVNANWLRVTRITVNLPNLPAAWHGRNVALVTDLHLGNVRGARFARRVVAKIQSLQPNAVFISGDLFDGTKVNLAAMTEPWKKLAAPNGIYFVTGNHEEFTDRTKFIAAVERVGIRILNNEKVDVNGLQIVGLHDGDTDDPKNVRTLLQRADLDGTRPSILLAHQPSNLAVAEEEGISLQLSGHTHGGQIWPWTHLAARVHGRFNHGLNRLGDLLVYTSNGAGTWGVPMRLGTKSEIVLIRLQPPAASRTTAP